MARPRVKLNNKGFSQLRKSPAVKRELKRRAEAIAAEAGEGFEVGEYEGRTRARASVITTTGEAIRANARDNRLVAALYRQKGR